MMRVWGGSWKSALVGLVLVLTASCGGASTSEVAGPVDESPQVSSAETSASATPEAPEPETAVTAVLDGGTLGSPDGECGQSVTMVELNAPVEAVMFDTKQYLCVLIPEGVARVVFELSGMTAALNLFVGYPNLVTLEAGGDQFWASEQGGRDDESIIIEPDSTGFVSSGAYFVEISGGASADGASFVLTVSTS